MTSEERIKMLEESERLFARLDAEIETSFEYWRTHPEENAENLRKRQEEEERRWAGMTEEEIENAKQIFL